MDSVSQWSIEQVSIWIESLSKEKGIGDSNVLKQNFSQNKIDGEALLKLDRELIRVLGIILVSDIIKIEEAIANLKQGTFPFHSLF
jgi:hypothetical protein